MALNYSGIYWLDKYGTKHTISTMRRYKKGEGYSTVWSSSGNGGIEIEDNTDIATPAEYFTFTALSNGTYSIAAADVTNMPTEVILPNMYNGKRVTMVANFGFVKINNGILNQWCKITSLIVPEGYTHIGGAAFGLNGIKTLGLPKTLISIGASAFASNSIEGSIYISDRVTVLGEDAFDSVSNATFYCGATSQPNSWLGDWNPNNCFVVWGYNLIDDDYFTFTEQTDGTYSVKAIDVSNLPSEVGIPFSYNGKAVTAIDENAFYSATINKVVIPEGVTRIGNGAFDNCTRLLDVTLPSTLTEIGGWAFRDCTALTSIVIPIGVTTIGTWAFLRDMSLTINCEAASQPSGWHTDWNISGGTVVWGYAG